MSVQSCSIFMILLDGILSSGQLIIPAVILAIDLRFLLGSFKLKWSDELSLNKKNQPLIYENEKSHNYGVDLHG